MQLSNPPDPANAIVFPRSSDALMLAPHSVIAGILAVWVEENQVIFRLGHPIIGREIGRLLSLEPDYAFSLTPFLLT